MNKTTIVAFLILVSCKLSANDLNPEINNIESQWAKIYYTKTCSEQKLYYPALIEKTKLLADKYPKTVEPIIWQAIIIATNAAFEPPFKALDSINTAKELLEQSIKEQPKALQGAAFVVLGTLYYMTPGWPISFGDQKKAESLFKRALKINPSSIDTNYFYADYLLTQNKLNSAQKYFKRAINLAPRPHQHFADTQLKKEAMIALKNTELRKLETGKNKFLSLFSSASAL
ncbi:MAG: hypothetical protein GQ475_01145 [Methylococcaceae bacterium]|nr:hypothetical protein [Methylococcaceae bacterium]